MAPNLEVKSESWLDLSQSVELGKDDNLYYYYQQQRQQQQQGQQNRYRYSIGSYFPTASELNQNQVSSANVKNSNEHLLIRLRQQSYLNSRSTSSASLSSNLSKSIELNEVDISRASSVSRDPKQNLLKKTPARLSSIRESLRSKRIAQRQPPVSNNQHKSKSPIVRSFSSLSDRLSGQFTRFRHSWKHFLYSCNQATSTIGRDSSILVEHDHAQRFEVNDLNFTQTTDNSNHPALGASSTIDKQQLTDLWLKRHHQLQSEGKLASSADTTKRRERARSLEVTLLRTTNNEELIKSISISRESENLVKLFTPVNKRNKSHHQDHRTPSSSTTLVSSSPLDSLGSSTPKTSSMISSGKHQSANQLKVTPVQRTPTSDYWSSAVTNEASDDYYKRHQTSRRAPQDMVNFPATAPNRLTLSYNQDQDYYLEVAKQQEQAQIISPVNDEDDELMQYEQPDLEEDFEDYAVPADESCRLDRSQVELVQMIGEGQKGYVFLGKLQSKDGRHIQDVAIKTLKYETSQLIERLMREAAMMRQLEHPHIIKFIGVCPETPALIAMELAEFGELKGYLKFNKLLLRSSQLVLFAFQISTALSYLESKQYVHRDVAARNVLVCSHNCVKLADFGLSRNLKMPAELYDEDETSTSIHQQQSFALALSQQQQQQQQQQQKSNCNAHYVASPRGKLPVRWLAPESLAFRRFTSASDVWMFGVFTWELFHFGQIRPWPNIRNNQVLLAIESGQKLSKPQACPVRLYQLLQRCWSYAPIQRPKFRELKQTLWSIYLTERTREQLELERQHRAHQQQVHQIEQVRRRAEQIASDESLMQLNCRNRQNLLRMSASPLPSTTGGTATYSSYSSTATTHSNDDSSRSSTMNSLARHNRQQVAALVSPYVPLAAEEARARFQQKAGFMNGHLLRKQRSQGSIVQQSGQFNSRCSADQQHNSYTIKPIPPSSRDDLWLSESTSHNQLGNMYSQRPFGDIRPTSFQYFNESKFGVPRAQLDIDEDEDELVKKDEDELKKEAEEFKQVEKRLAQLQLNNPITEPAYEGLYKWQGEVAMIRSGDLNPTHKLHHHHQQPRDFNNCQVNLNPQQARQQSAVKQHKPERRLTPFNQNNHLLQQHREVEGGRIGQQVVERRSENKETSMSGVLDEEQRQFALHQKLLGNIRPEPDEKRKSRSGCDLSKNSNRSTGAAVEQATVEQSLELLESLIKGKNFSQTPKVQSTKSNVDMNRQSGLKRP